MIPVTLTLCQSNSMLCYVTCTGDTLLKLNSNNPSHSLFNFDLCTSLRDDLHEIEMS